MNCERAEEIINGFSGKKILVVGDIVLDHYVKGVTTRLNPEVAVPLLDVQEEYNATGAAGNVAKNIVELTASATLITVVGTDQVAEDVVRAAQAEKYKLFVASDSSRPTPRKIRFLAGSQPLLRVDTEKKHDVSSKIEDKLIELINQHINSHQAILISDYAKGVITKRIAEQVMNMAKDQNIPIAIDAKPSRLPYFKGATFMSPNKKEAKEALGLAAEVSIDSAELATRFAHKFKTTACVTLSADGVVVAGPDQKAIHIPQGHVSEVIDGSGAGDAAIVAMLLARLDGASWNEAAEIGNAAGAVVVSHVGAIGVTASELHDILCHHHG